jgi:alkylhydroperoxidase family enzyme
LPDKTLESLTYGEEIIGFAPIDVLAMAHWPELLAAMQQMVSVIYKPGVLEPALKRMIGTINSRAAGCSYCQAHRAHGAAKMAGGEEAKIAAVWEYQASPLFNDAERAALDLALVSGRQPSGATDAHFRALEKHFTRQQIMEIMGVIGLFGFLNRCNDTLATELADAPPKLASQTYTSDRWKPGRHKR